MFNHDILISPIMLSDNPDRQGEYFLVLHSSGSISQPNGIHHGTGLAEKTRSSYLKNGIMEADTIEEFDKMKDWYLHVIPHLKHTLLDTLNFAHKELLEYVEEAFPDEGKE